MKEFKKFINRGNVVDLAVGLIMATYFGAIVKSLVNDVIMPPVGLLLGGVNFLIVSFSIFIAVKMYNKAQEPFKKEEKEEEAKSIPPSKQEVLLTEIRDLLKK